MRARDIMTREPECCRADQTAQEAAQVMRDRDCGCVPRSGRARDRLGQGLNHQPQRTDDAGRGELRARRRSEGSRAEDGRAAGAPDSDRRHQRALPRDRLASGHRARVRDRQSRDGTGNSSGGREDLPAARQNSPPRSRARDRAAVLVASRLRSSNGCGRHVSNRVAISVVFRPQPPAGPLIAPAGTRKW